MHRQYTNELTPELLATMDQPPFTAEELAEGVRSLIAEQEAFCRQHPVIAVYRPDSPVLPGRAGVPVAEDFLAQPGA